MALAFNGSSDSITLLNDVWPSGVPVTMAAWVRSSDTANAQCVFAIANYAFSGDELSVWLRGDVGGDPIQLRCIAVNGSGSFEANDGTGYSANTWMHVCAVFATTTSRTLYKDGSSIATGTANLAPSLTNGNRAFALGARAANGAVDLYLAGGLMHFGMWNVALNADEAAALAKGYSPQDVRPTSLVAVNDTPRSTIERRGIAWNVSGVTALDGPAVMMPRRRRAVSAGATSPPPPPPPPSVTLSHFDRGLPRGLGRGLSP